MSVPISRQNRAISPRPAVAIRRGHSVEPLEARRLFAASILAHGSSLVIVGDDKPNTISVSLTPTGVDVTVDTAATKRFSFGASNGGVARFINDISIQGRGGNDVITVHASAQSSDYFIKMRLYADGGSGDDTMSAACDVAASSAKGMQGACTMLGGTGNDTIDSSFTGGGRFAYKWTNFVDGGAGDDAISSRCATDEAASDSPPGVVWTVSSTVRGSAGRDSIDVDCAFDQTTLAGVSAACTVDGGSDADSILSSFSWGASNSLSFTHQKITYLVKGGSGDDAIDARFVGNIGSSGQDGVSLSPSSITCAVDGGSGSDVVTSACDVVEQSTTASKIVFKMQLQVVGGSGDDDLTATVSSDKSSPSLATIACVVQGGSGFDTALVTGSSVSVLSVEEVTDLDASGGGVTAVDDWLQ